MGTAVARTDSASEIPAAPPGTQDPLDAAQEGFVSWNLTWEPSRDGLRGDPEDPGGAWFPFLFTQLHSWLGFYKLRNPVPLSEALFALRD